MNASNRLVLSSNTQNTEIDDTQILEALKNLVKRDIIVNVSLGFKPRYKFKIDLYRLWILENKSPHSISDEELKW